LKHLSRKAVPSLWNGEEIARAALDTVPKRSNTPSTAISSTSEGGPCGARLSWLVISPVLARDRFPFDDAVYRQDATVLAVSFSNVVGRLWISRALSGTAQHFRGILKEEAPVVCATGADRL